MSISERTLKDGTKVYDVVVYTGFTVNGKRDRKKVTCRTKRAAELEHAKLVSKRDAMRGRSGRITLGDYISDHYWPVAVKRLAATSLDTYEKEVRLRIVPSLGNVDIRDIDRARIQRMVDGIATESVARKCVGVLKTILNEAKGDGLIATNPAQATFAMPQKGARRGNGAVLTTFGQIRAMLEIVRQNGSQCVQRIAYTGLLQGLRPEERYALDWKDIDADRGTLTVCQAHVAASRKHGGVHTKGTKTEAGTRTIPMHPEFAEWLAGLPNGGGPFIVGTHGGRISPSTAQNRWRKFLKDNAALFDEAGIPPVTIENMRHSFATSYLAAGGRVETLSKMLGHCDIATTYRRYVRPDIGSMADDMMRVAMG